MYMLMQCGSMAAEIDNMVPIFVTNVVKILQFGIPIILIVLGMLDLGKAVMSNEEKEMKTAQKTLIKRVVYAVLVFFIIAIVKFVFQMLSNSTSSDETKKKDFTSCIDCFLDYDADKEACQDK